MPSLAFALFAAAPAGFSAHDLWDAWPERRFVATPAPCLRHAELVERLRALAARFPGGVLADRLIAYWSSASQLSKRVEERYRDDQRLMERVARGELRHTPPRSGWRARRWRPTTSTWA